MLSSWHPTNSRQLKKNMSTAQEKRSCMMGTMGCFFGAFSTGKTQKMRNPLAPEATCRVRSIVLRFGAFCVSHDIDVVDWEDTAPLVCKLVKPGERLFVFGSGVFLELAKRVSPVSQDGAFTYSDSSLMNLRMRHSTPVDLSM